MEETELTAITNAINSHGFPFQKAVKREVLKFPKIKIIGEEYPVSYLGESSSIDLLVELENEIGNIIIPIECKRAYTKDKKWLFYPDLSGHAKLVYYFDEKNLQTRDASHFSSQFQSCMQGIEISNLKLDKKEGYGAASTNAIINAANQVCLSTHGFVLSELKNRQKGKGVLGKQFILPVIVTNAPLYIIKTPDEAVDIETGNVLDSIKIVQVESIILNHPFSIETKQLEKLEVVTDDYKKPEDRYALSREGILIVSLKSLNSVLTKVK